MAGLFMVRTKSVYLGQTMNPFYNMFGYQSFLTVTDEIVELMNNFESGVIPKIIDVLHTSMEIVEADVTNLDDGGFYSRGFASTLYTGTRTGDAMPDFVAWGFKYLRAVSGGRAGGKRFGSISEADVLAGIASGAVITNLNALASQLGSALRLGIVDTWFPVIMQKPATVGDPWTPHALSSVTYTGVTTQNSRKR